MQLSKKEDEARGAAPAVHVDRVEDFLDHVFDVVALGGVREAARERLEVRMGSFQRRQQVAEVARLPTSAKEKKIRQQKIYVCVCTHFYTEEEEAKEAHSDREIDVREVQRQREASRDNDEQRDCKINKK